MGPEWRFASTIPGEAVARVLIAGRVICFYFCKLLWPYPLMFEYPRWHVDVTDGWQYLFPAAVIAALLLLWLLRNRVGRGPLCAMLFFAGTLFPALGINNIYPMRFSFVADHFQYLACVGPLALIAAALHRKLLYPAAVLIIGLLAVLTFSRVTIFRSEESLYADSIEKNPNGWMTQSNLGALLIADKKLDEATMHLQIGLRLHPNNATAAMRMAQIAQLRNDLPDAMDWAKSAEAMEPKLPEPHIVIAQCLEKSGEPAAAIDEYTIATQLQPDRAQFHLDLGVILSRQKRFAEAVVQFDEAVRLDPQSKDARIDRLAALERAGDLDRAADELHAMLSTDPTFKLWRELGVVETLRHHPQEAADAFTTSLRLNPNQPEVQNRLENLKQAMQPAAP
jgi:tetratricopeptide (TPR) repeat protein